MHAQTILLLACVHIIVTVEPLRAQTSVETLPLASDEFHALRITQQPIHYTSAVEAAVPISGTGLRILSSAFQPTIEPPADIQAWREAPLQTPAGYPTQCYPTQCYPTQCYPTQCYPTQCYPSTCYQPTYPNNLSGCRVKISPYGWLSGVRGRTTLRGITTDVNVGSSELLDFLDLVDGAAFGRLEVNNGPFGVLFDTYWIALGLDQEIIGLDFSAQFEMAIVDFAFSCQLEGVPQMLSLPPSSEIELLAGGRYWSLEGAGTITSPNGIFTARFAGKQDWIDPIIGSRLTIPLNPLATLKFRGDLGGFGWGTASDFSWNAEVLFERRWSECCTLVAGYRIMDVDNHRGSGNQEFAWDMQFRGPIFQVVFRF